MYKGFPSSKRYLDFLVCRTNARHIQYKFSLENNKFTVDCQFLQNYWNSNNNSENNGIFFYVSKIEKNVFHLLEDEKSKKKQILFV